MAISDIYTQNSNQSPAISTKFNFCGLAGTSTKRVWLVGVRMEIVTTSATAGGNVLFQLYRPTNAVVTTSGTGNVTGNPQDFAAPAGLATFWSTSGGIGTMSTPPTANTLLADWELPQTSGSAWEEFPPLGYEWGIPALAAGAGAGIWMFITMAQASATTISVDFIWSE